MYLFEYQNIGPEILQSCKIEQTFCRGVKPPPFIKAPPSPSVDYPPMCGILSQRLILSLIVPEYTTYITSVCIRTCTKMLHRMLIFQKMVKSDFCHFKEK